MSACFSTHKEFDPNSRWAKFLLKENIVGLEIIKKLADEIGNAARNEEIDPIETNIICEQIIWVASSLIDLTEINKHSR